MMSGSAPSPSSGGGSSMRTGLTHTFHRGEGVDRRPAESVWRACREGRLTGPTAGAAPGFTQANLVVLPKAYAFDFLMFCLRNPKACPLKDVTEAGQPCFEYVAPGANITTDLPRYRVWRHGEMHAEMHDVEALFTEEMVGFALGCSFSWEGELAARGLLPRHLEMACNVPMYRTNVKNAPVGRFAGELVVSMRPYKPEDVPTVTRVTARYPGAHGAPVHVGNPAQLGIADLAVPDYGDAVPVRDGEVPVFWACGVTPQVALEAAGLPLAITHAPGHMLVCDVLTSELRVDDVEDRDLSDAAALEAQRLAKEVEESRKKPPRPTVQKWPANLESLAEKVQTIEGQLNKAEAKARIKDDTKEVSLTTSKNNYIDPRVICAWAQRENVRVDQVYSARQIQKFPWAINIDPDYRF